MTDIVLGRPTVYTEETANYICEQMSDGKSLTDICKADNMPARSTVYRWLGLNKTFSDLYARAEAERAEVMSDEIIAICDESYNDHIIDDNGNVKVNAEAIARSRLRVDTRKWVMCKLKPRKYGDKLDLAIPNGIQITKIERHIVKPDH